MFPRENTTAIGVIPMHVFTFHYTFTIIVQFYKYYKFEILQILYLMYYLENFFSSLHMILRFIHIALYSLSTLLTLLYSILMHIPQFIHVSVDGLLGCLRFFTIKSIAEINLFVFLLN